MYHEYDAVIVGAGGAGLMAALELSRDPDLKVTVLSKLYPTRSHTGAAQGGVGAALGSEEKDRWEWHAYDTIKGSDFLADQDAVEVMCRDAIGTVVRLEHMGLPFDRTPAGRIAQRRFGGHTNNETGQPVRRACYSADRTGHMILQTLYQQCIKNGVEFFDEYHVLDLPVSDGACAGVVAYEVATGELHTFHAKAVLFATGGHGKIYKITSNAFSLTGDGAAIALRRGVPLEDMEFYQFHPTGIYRMGILLSEAARGEGAILINDAGERFMERYAPTMKDLASRDVTSRAIYTEIKEGRGIGGKDYVYLDMRHLGRDVIEAKLPEIAGFIRTYMGIDPAVEPTPVQPTAHYAMGGIPTDIDGRVLVDETNTPMPGFYAAGECACVSVHGGNRLGTNSLLDIVVFGRRAGNHMAAFCREADLPELPEDPQAAAREAVQRVLSGTGAERVGAIREDLQREMMDRVSVYRTRESMQGMVALFPSLRERYGNISIEDKGKRFNLDLLEALELGFMLDIAEVTAASALAREESRGAHSRADFPDRDDRKWLVHTLARLTPKGVELKYKPVTITKYQPKERKY